MLPEPADPLAAAVLLADAFDRYAVEYAIGGALAYSLYGIPRATIDVDVNVFSAPSELDPVFDALGSLGIEVKREQAVAASEQRGMFVTQLGIFRLDLFTPSIEFCSEAKRTRVQRVVDGQGRSVVEPLLPIPQESQHSLDAGRLLRVVG